MRLLEQLFVMDNVRALAASTGVSKSGFSCDQSPGKAPLFASAYCSERDAFLAGFTVEHGETLVGFAVLGGVFGEGIDLVGERRAIFIVNGLV